MTAAAQKPQHTGRSRATDRILRGRLATEVARFGVPLAIGMGLQTTFNLVDAYLVSRIGGRVGNAAMGAIAPCDNLAAVGTILAYGLSVASGTMISHAHGKGDEQAVRRIAWQSTLLILFISGIFAVSGVVGARWLLEDVTGTKGLVTDVGVPYLQVMMGGGGTMFLLLHLITIQRALGSSKTPITMLVVANAANLLLAAVLVYGPGEAPTAFGWAPELAERLGIPRLELLGAGWATVLARALVLVPTFWIAFRRHHLFGASSREKPDSKVLSKIWNIGWPTSSQMVVRIVGIMVVIKAANEGYTTADNQDVGTALSVVLRWETMALFVGLGWGSASQTFLGQNLGAGAEQRAKASGWYATAYNAAMMTAFALLCLFAGEQLVAFFTPTPGVVAIGVEYFQWVAPSYVGLGIGIVLGSAIQGAGATRLTFLIDSAGVVLLQIPLCLVVAMVIKGPVSQLWQSVALVYYLLAVVYLVVYHRGAFLRETSNVPEVRPS